MKRGSWNRLVIGLNGVALSFLILELIIGDTILGNLILIALAGLVLIAATLVGVIDLLERRSMESVVPLFVSSVLIIYILSRFYYDTVSAGYGP